MQPPLYSSLVIICTLYCTTINIGPNWFIPYYSPLPPSEQRSSAFNISLFMFNKLLFWYRTRVLHKLFTSFACPTHISSFTTINYSFTDIQESYQEQIRLDKRNNKSIKGIAMYVTDKLVVKTFGSEQHIWMHGYFFQG